MASNQFNLLTKKRFMPLFLTQFLGICNDHMLRDTVFAFGIYTLGTQYSFSNKTISILVSMVCLAPFLIFSGHAGFVGDKYEKSFILRSLKVLELLTVVLAGIAFYLNSIWLLLLVLGAMALKATYFFPVKHSIMPELLHPDELIGGNAFVATGSFLSVFLGLTLGFTLIRSLDNMTMVTCVMLIIAVLGLLISYKINRGESFAPDLTIGANLLYLNFKVISLSYTNKIVFLCIICIAWFWGVNFIYLLEFPYYCSHVLHSDQHIMLTILILLVVVIGVGALLCNLILHSKIRLTFVPLSLMLMFVFSIDIYYSSLSFMQHNNDIIYTFSDLVYAEGGLRIIFDIMLFGFGGGVFVVPLYATLQNKSDPIQRARNVACSGLMNAFSIFLVILIAVSLAHFGVSVLKTIWLVPISALVLLLYFSVTVRSALHD